MAEQTDKIIKKKLTKKQAAKEVYERLSVALAVYKNGSGGKKFDRKLQKASKLFAPYVIKEALSKKV